MNPYRSASERLLRTSLILLAAAYCMRWAVTIVLPLLPALGLLAALVFTVALRIYLKRRSWR